MIALAYGEIGWTGRVARLIRAAQTDQSPPINYTDGSPTCLTLAVAISPTDRPQHGPHTGNRTDKQQHGESNHQEECRSHVVQNRDHTASLLLLDVSTAPSTGTDPWTHRISFLKRSPATGALPSPHSPHPLSAHCNCTYSLTIISAKPTHRITLFL